MPVSPGPPAGTTTARPSASPERAGRTTIGSETGSRSHVDGSSHFAGRSMRWQTAPSGTGTSQGTSFSVGTNSAGGGVVTGSGVVATVVGGAVSGCGGAV